MQSAGVPDDVHCFLPVLCQQIGKALELNKIQYSYSKVNSLIMSIL